MPAGFCVSLILGDCLCCAPSEENDPEECSCCQQKKTVDTTRPRQDCFTFTCGCPGVLAGTLPLEIHHESTRMNERQVAVPLEMIAGRGLEGPLARKSSSLGSPGSESLLYWGKLFVLQGVLLI